MNKNFCILGFMSGTSADGVDVSVVNSNGKNNFEVILNKYYKYDQKTYKNIHKIRENVTKHEDIKLLSKQIAILEKEITLFHAKIFSKISKLINKHIDYIGFHGQTIYHNSSEKISKQIGDGMLLSKLTKKKVVYNFRENDLKNGGEGAPLTPIFHKFIIKKKKLDLPVSILNIGGIANITSINKQSEILSFDIGPGNCLIDKWIRMNSNKLFDRDGLIARKGKVDRIILNQFLDNYYNNKISIKKSLDLNDFDLHFVRGLSLENGAATLTELTSEILSTKIINKNIYVCGGGRQNKFLIENIEKKIGIKIKLIDDLGIDGDFVESQAFAYIAIRSVLKLPISFPKTTGCKKPSTGGVIAKNF